MALPPLTAAEDAPPPAPGLDAPEAANGPTVFATIMKLPDGKFLLVDGDEPEGGEMGAGEPGMMNQSGVDGPALLKQLMAKIEGGDGAQQAMEQGFADDEAPMPEPAPMKPPVAA